jgi:hypothetical protein
MEVEAVRSTGATLTEALTAAERQMDAQPATEVTPSEEEGSGFFAGLLARLGAKPTWTEHPWQVGVNRRGMKVTATRWAKGRTLPRTEILSPPQAERGKPVQTEQAVLPSPQQPGPTEQVEPTSDEQQSFGYGLDEVLPPELLKESPLLQRDVEAQKASSPEQVSRRMEQRSPRFTTLLAARVYDEAALLYSAQRLYDGLG